jgi:2-keto-myo-inositol isomerase
MAMDMNRRDLMLGGSALAGGLAGCARAVKGASEPALVPPAPAAARRVQLAAMETSFVLGLNTSTLRGQKLSLVQEIDIAAKAGYRAMEPWVDEIERYAASGGSLDDLGKRFRDAGITVASAIGFFEWIVDDPERRRKGLEATRRAMEMLRRIGGLRLAAPPVGATDKRVADLLAVAERYRALLELGDRMGVVPQVEIWGSSQTLGKLGEAACVAIEAHHTKACILPDVYHLYRGGSDFKSVKLLGAGAIHVFHINDYPADPPRGRITDADRVYPGDGIAPLKDLLSDLADARMHVTLSLELFNRKYWAQDPQLVARTGLEKMRKILRDE